MHRVQAVVHWGRLQTDNQIGLTPSRDLAEMAPAMRTLFAAWLEKALKQVLVIAVISATRCIFRVSQRSDPLGK